MYNRLLEFLEIYKIRINSQFGFRKSHSTYMALMTRMDRLITSLENDEHVIGIFLDFSRAFDTVDHAILLEKLSHYGIRGNALKWFESYIICDLQWNIINYKNCQVWSSTGITTWSSAILVDINDLCSVCKHTFPILFADDTNLFSSGKEIKTLETNINSELSDISIWLKVNKLSLNVKKTHYMISPNTKKDSLSVKLSIDGELINEVDRIKFLGILIENKLTWKQHIAYVSAKIPRAISIIIKGTSVSEQTRIDVILLFCHLSLSHLL